MIRLVFILLVISGFGPIASAQQASAQEQLAESRQQIDKIDRQIVDLINQRAAVVNKIGEIKSAAGLPISAPGREQQVLKHVADLGVSGPFPAARLKAIYATVLTQMREWEQEQQHSPK
ncbi:MAG TPA: chorismate mutase [Bryobacteraceae bacterium]